MMTWRHALGNPYPHVDHLFHGGDWILDVSDAMRAQIGETLKRLPLAIEVETSKGNIGIVHADCPTDDWHDMHTSPTASDIYCCQWSVDRIANNYAAPIKNIRAVIHGHCRLPKAKILGNVYYIDTSGWPRNGHLTFIELESLKIHEGPRTHDSYPDWVI